jgi:hypothetical protein
VPEAVYVPSPWAQRYHACTVFELLGAGSAGVGKSLALLMDPLSNIITEQKRCESGEIAWGESKGWALHLRRREGTLAQTIRRAKTLYPKIIPGTTWREKDLWLEFPCGYRLQFGHCNNIGDYENYMSNEYDWVGFDELIEFDQLQYENISGRCRTSDPVLRPMRRVRAMSNPYQQSSGSGKSKVRNPFWVRDYFVEPAPQGNVVLKRTFIIDGIAENRDRMYMPGSLADNPDREFARDYEATLRSKPRRIRDPLLKGNWWLTGGSFFDDWDNRIHVKDPFQIPDHWHMFRSCDWGFKTHGCILWFAQDDDGDLWCVKEFSFRNMMPDEISKTMRSIEEGLGLHWRGGNSPITGPADHDLWEERGNLNAEPKILTFLRNGVRWVKANKKDPASNAQLFAQRLRDHNEYTTNPGIMFFSTCRKCITTIPSIQTSDENPEVPAATYKHHWYMAASYAAAYVGGVTRTRDNSSPDDDWDEDERYNAPKPPGGYAGYGIRY